MSKNGTKREFWKSSLLGQRTYTDQTAQGSLGSQSLFIQPDGMVWDEFREPIIFIKPDGNVWYEFRELIIVDARDFWEPIFI